MANRSGFGENNRLMPAVSSGLARVFGCSTAFAIQTNFQGIDLQVGYPRLGSGPYSNDARSAAVQTC